VAFVFLTPGGVALLAARCPGPHPGRLSGLRISHNKSNKSGLYGAFVWTRTALNSQKRWFLDRAVLALVRAGCRVVSYYWPLAGALLPALGRPAAALYQRTPHATVARLS
jgi:hypothetical protein